MTKWEYRHARFLSDDEIADYGQEGWELVSVVVIADSTHYYFKRPYPFTSFTSSSIR